MHRMDVGGGAAGNGGGFDPGVSTSGSHSCMYSYDHVQQWIMRLLY